MPDTYKAVRNRLTSSRTGARHKWAMGPFSIAVFRIRLLLLAMALGLTGFGSDKNTPGIVDAGKPIKAVSASCNPPQRNPRQLAVVNGVDCGAHKPISTKS
jgi:hypothetical protein